MSYLVDSDWIADYLKGRQPAVDLINELARDHLGLSLITYGEVYQGVYYGADPRRYEAAFQRLLNTVEVVGLDEAIMRRAARIRGALRRQGQSIALPDVIIGATALHYDLTLVTRNIRHLGRIPGLKLYETE